MRKLIRKMLRVLPDKTYIQFVYFVHFHKFANLKNPKTFNEKIQWLKLYDRKEEYTAMVDKYLVKDYVAAKIGEEYLIPTLGVWDSPEEIDFDLLPQQFVLKWNHDSGSIVICKDKSKLNTEDAIKKLQKGKNYSGFWYGREWPYKNVKAKVIVEKYMEDSKTKDLRDYKFFCSNGVPILMYVATDRQADGDEVKLDFFDMDYRHIDVRQGHPNANIIPQKPQKFQLMKELASELSKGIPHVRVDFYEANEEVYFGEMTFYHFSGFLPFEPKEWDLKFGECIKLPENVRGE